MAATKVIVELSADEERLLNAFRKAEAADEKMRANFQKTGVVIESSGRAISDAMIKAGEQSNASLNKMMATLRQTGGEGRKLASGLEQFMHDFELAGRKSVQSVLGDLERIDPIIATQAQIMLDQWESADKAEKFENTRRQISALGGEFVTLASQIKKAMAFPSGADAEASRLIAELEKIDPEKADALRRAIEETAKVSREVTLDQLVSQLNHGTAEAKSLAGAIQAELKTSVIGAAGGFDAMKAKILALRPELAGTIDEWKAAFDAADKADKFESTKRQMRELGGYWATLADSIGKARVEEGKMSEEGHRLLAVLEQIDPDAFQQISHAITAANVALDNTKFDKMLAGLAGSTRETQSLVNLVGTELKKATLEAEGGIEGMKQQIVAMYPEMKQAIALWEQANADADKSEKFTDTTKQLEALGGEYAVLARKIREATATPLGDADDEARKILAELDQIDPAKADAIRRAMQQTRDAVDKTRLDQFMAQLSGGTQEAQALAKAIGQGVTDAALQAEGGIDGIAAKIVALRPESAAFVEKWRAEMADAAKYGEGQFAEMFNALRAGDKVSKATADRLKEHFVRAGLIVEKSFEDMIAPLDKIDPKLAAQARMFKDHFEKIESRGKGAFSGIAKLATTEIAQIATAYIGVQEAIQAVTEAIREQEEVRKNAADAHRSLATAQIDAFKNLSTLPKDQQRDLLENFVPQVAKETAFPDLPNLTKAVGDARSAGASLEQLKEAVRAAAELNALTTEFVDETAAALVDAARATGNVNAKQNASQLFLIGSEARIVDPAKLFRNVSPVQIAGSVNAGVGRGKEGAMEGGALFAALTRVGADATGDASQTASIQFISKMSEFFKNLGDSKSATVARGKLAELQTRDGLSASERLTMDNLIVRKNNKFSTDQKIATATTVISEIEQRERTGQGSARSKKEDSFRKRELTRELSSLRAMEFDATEAAKLEDILRKLPGGKDYEDKVSKLQTIIAAGEVKNAGQYRGLDTVGEQLKAMQSNRNLASSFMEDKFGEQRFRPGYEQLVTGGEAYQDFLRTRKLLSDNQGSDRLYREKVEQSRYGTRQLEEAYGQRQSETAKVVQDSFDSQAAQANFRTEFENVMKDTRTSLSQYFLQPYLVQAGGLGGDAGSGEILSGVKAYLGRRDRIARDGVTPEEAPKIERLDAAIEAAIQRLSSSTTIQSSPKLLRSAAQSASQSVLDARQGLVFGTDTGGGVRAPNSVDIEVFNRLESILNSQLELQRQQLEASQGTQKNTRPQPRRTSDAQVPAAVAANGRGRRP